MKRITRSLLSLCLAFVLCAALLPNVNVANAAEGDDKESATPKTTSFLITGYEASRSSIYTGDSVNITVHLSRTDGGGSKIRVVRGLDSFQGGTADAVADGQNGDYTVTFSNLTYAGDSDKRLAFTIYYSSEDGLTSAYQDGNSVPIRECVPYTEPKPEPEPTPETIPAPRAVFNSDGMVSAIAAGETKVITVYIQNAGTTAMRDPILTLKSSGSLLIMGSQDYMLDDIRAGRDTAVNVTVKALDKVESQMQTIDASLSFYYDDGTQLTNGSASGSVNVLSAVSNDGQNEDIASPTPIVILSKYNYGGSSVAAGTNLSFSFTNTSKKLAIENVMVTVTGGSDLMLNGSTNTFYFDSVAAGGSKSVTVPMKAAQLISASAQDVQIAVTYEYVDQNARKSGSATLSLSVPLYQPDRFELSEPKTSYTGYVGEETSLTIDYVNKGKSAISNVDATISGDIDSPTPYQRVGTIDGGKNGTIAFAVTPQLEGENQVKIVITYEDSNGNTKERVFEATVEAMAYEPADPGMDDPGMIDPEPASTFPWKYVIIAVVAALIVLLIVLRIRKKKAKQKAEQALWDKWDEEELAEEKKEAADAAAENKEGAATGAEEQNK